MPTHVQDPARSGLDPEAPLLLAGALVPFVFAATTLLCGWVMGDYNHLSRMVSELGALGTPSRLLFTVGLVLCAALSLGFILGLLRGCARLGRSTLPVWILLAFTVSTAGAGLVPLPLHLHLVFGMPADLLFLSPLAAIFMWPRDYARTPAVLSLGIMALGFLAFFPDILPEYPGLKQRFFHLGWSVWFIHLSVAFAGSRGGRGSGMG